MKYYKKFSAAVSWCYMAAACVFLVVIISMTFVQVVSRYVFNNSITWTEELARYSFVWCNMLAATAALRHVTHPSITLLQNKLKGKVLHTQQMILYLVVVVAALVMIVQGANVMRVAHNNLSTMLRIPMSYVYLSVVVGGVGILVQSVEKILDELGRLAGKTPDGAAGLTGSEAVE